MIYKNPNTEGSLVQFKERYENYIGGEWVAPVDGKYLDVVSPVDGKVFTSVPRSNDKDLELAFDAAHAAKKSWGKTSVAERALVLTRIADRIEENLEMLAEIGRASCREREEDRMGGV